MEATGSDEILGRIYEVTWRRIPEKINTLFTQNVGTYTTLTILRFVPPKPKFFCQLFFFPPKHSLTLFTSDKKQRKTCKDVVPLF
jgi:hypothetical protein